MRCAVIGGGAWGTALADLLAANEHEVVLWSLEPDVASSINRCHENQRFLEGLPLASSLRATNDQAEAVAGAQLVVYAVPSQHLRRVAASGASSVASDATLAVATKGIERGTLALMTSVIEAELPERAGSAYRGRVLRRRSWPAIPRRSLPRRATWEQRWPCSPRSAADRFACTRTTT